MLLLQNQRRVTIEEGPMGTGNRHSHQLPCRQLRAMIYSLFVISSGCIDLWLTTYRNRGGVVTDFTSPWTAAGRPPGGGGVHRTGDVGAARPSYSIIHLK